MLRSRLSPFPKVTPPQLITNHIDDVEALGDIGALNMEAISKALSKNRGLYVSHLVSWLNTNTFLRTPENAHLFYNASNTTLTLFDATSTYRPQHIPPQH
jgi:DNA repair protein RAD7